jgi:hypothetical protein
MKENRLITLMKKRSNVAVNGQRMIPLDIVTEVFENSLFGESVDGYMDVDYYNAHRDVASPLMRTESGMITGFWMTGNDYHNASGYYGAYPPGYMKKMSLLFPRPDVVLHLFSGKTPKGSWGSYPVKEVTCDIKEEVRPDVVEDAHHVDRSFEPGTFDLILSDPPYLLNYEKYGTSPVNKKLVVKKCAPLLCRGGHLVWLDCIMPIWAKRDGWKLVGTIGLVQSTNHQVRVATILEKIS